jgi:hypothetical protein
MASGVLSKRLQSAGPDISRPRGLNAQHLAYRAGDAGGLLTWQ